MKILSLLLLFTASSASAQRNDTLLFRLKTDTCIFHGKLINSQPKEFSISVVNTSNVLSLFKKDSQEFGIKLYVNHITEDGNAVTIMKHVFMEKTETGWKEFNTGDYAVVSYYPGQKTISIAGGEDDNFRIAFSLSLDPDYLPNLKAVPMKSALYD